MKQSARNLISAIIWALCSAVYIFLTIAQIVGKAEWYVIAVDAFIAVVSAFNAVMALLRHISEKRAQTAPTEQEKQ
jgi:hypothetical protein